MTVVLVLVPITAAWLLTIAILVLNEALRCVQVLHARGRQRVHVLVLVRLSDACSGLAQTACIVE